MSVYFCCENLPDLWNPSGIAGRLFRDQAGSVAQMLGIECGLGEVVSDEVAIDRAKFATFVSVFTSLMLQTNEESGVQVLAGGCFAIGLVLAEKLGMGPESTDPKLERFRSLGWSVVGQ